MKLKTMLKIILCALIFTGLQNYQIFAASDPTNKASFSPWCNNGGTIEDVSSALIGPITNAKTWKFVKTGTGNQWHGWEAGYNNTFNCSTGEFWTIAGYYKTSSPAGITQFGLGGIYKPDWSRPYNTTVVDSKIDIIPDGNWHYFFCTIRANEPIVNGIIADGPSWGYSTAKGLLYINGLQWTKTKYVLPIPNSVNSYTQITPWNNGGSWQDVTTSEPGPVPGSNTWKFTKTGSNPQWQGWEGNYGGIFTAARGECWTVAGYYRTSSPAGLTSLTVGSIYKPDWSGPYNTSVLDASVNIQADGKWHYFYCTIRANETITNGIIADGPSWNYSTSAGTLYINGLQWVKSRYNVMPGTGQTTPDVVDWSMFQTGIKNQHDRRTCFDFAIVAGIEARYKRDYGLELDLSEQFLHHLIKSTGLDTSQPGYSPYYQYENQSSYWGGGSAGCVEVAKQYNLCLETDINYNTSIGVNSGYLTEGDLNNLRLYINSRTGNSAGTLAWNGNPNLNTVTQAQVDAFEYSPDYIPYSAINAAAYGVKEYTQISAPKTPSAIEYALAHGYDVMIDFDTKWETDTDGIYQYNAAITDYEAHVILIVGYNRSDRVFTVKNSWGGNSMTRVRYDVIENLALEAYYIKSVRNPATPDGKGRFLGTYKMDHDGWKGTLVIRRTTNENNDITRLGHYIDQNGNSRAVNGSFIDGNRGIQFSIESSKYTDPTVMTGQVFYVDMFSSDNTRMAGYTTWENVPFGVFLSRTENPGIPGRFDGANEWAGSWRMNHDGWGGELNLSLREDTVNNIYVVYGTYRADDGNWYNVNGTINKNQAHIANITINYSTPQNFTLMYHTWEDGLFSGYTYWDGGRFGLYGTKY